MKQRIALVAVSALTAGVLSVASAPVANAAAAVDGEFTLATENSTTGVAISGAIGGIENARSLGVLNVTGTKKAVASNPTTLTLGGSTTGTILNTAVVAVQISSATLPAVTVVGGTLSGYTGTAGSAANFNGTNTAVASNVTGDKMHILVTPNAGVTSMTISGWTGAGLTALTATTGVLVGTYVLTVSTTALTGSFSAADSAVAITTSATAATITTSVDASTSGILAGNPLFIQMIANNAYGQALTSGTYVATATNGATVNWGALAPSVGVGSATAAGTLSVATLTPGDGTSQLRIDPSQSVTTSTTTVTITHNGTPVTTKTLTFYGEVKKIVIESVKSGVLGSSTAGGGNTATAYAVYSYRDSADGKVPGGAATFNALSATPSISTGVSVRSPSRSVQAAVGGTVITAALSTAIGVGTDGVFAFSCTTTPGATAVSISTTNTVSLATITAPVTVGCYGPIATYTVSTDKASYAVGEIATITIDAKDAFGNPVADNTVLTAASVSVGGGALTAAIAGTELFSAGKRTVQAQMTTAGKFNTVVTLAGSVTSTATTGYAVTDGGVSNAQVLQSIVALIASINKQIQALQKLILRR
jgi:hypothetical protein